MKGHYRLSKTRQFKVGKGLSTYFSNAEVANRNTEGDKMLTFINY